MFLIVDENSEVLIDLLSSLAGVSLLVAIFAINAYMYIKKRGQK